MVGMALRALALLGVAWVFLQQTEIVLPTGAWQFVIGLLGLAVVTAEVVAR